MRDLGLALITAGLILGAAVLVGLILAAANLLRRITYTRPPGRRAVQAATRKAAKETSP